MYVALNLRNENIRLPTDVSMNTSNASLNNAKKRKKRKREKEREREGED